jgi:hypothetical protein
VGYWASFSERFDSTTLDPASKTSSSATAHATRPPVNSTGHRARHGCPPGLPRTNEADPGGGAGAGAPFLLDSEPVEHPVGAHVERPRFPSVDGRSITILHHQQGSSQVGVVDPRVRLDLNGPLVAPARVVEDVGLEVLVPQLVVALRLVLCSWQVGGSVHRSRTSA